MKFQSLCGDFEQVKVWNFVKTYELISNSPLEFLISFVLKNTGYGNLYDHMKGLFDNHSCYELLMNCFCGMVNQQKLFSLISSHGHCQRSSPSWISDMPQAGFESVQNMSLGLVEWSRALVITTAPCHHPFSTHFYATLLSGCFWNFTFLIKGALHWLLHVFCTPETAGNVFAGILVIIIRASNIY